MSDVSGRIEFMRSRRQPFRPDIQGLRAIAVGFVVLYHAGTPILGGGYVGVDIFFVISGFLITNHLVSSLDNDGRIHFAAFYAKRARRILPASFFVLVLSLIAGLMLLPPLQRETIFQGAIATALYVPNLLFARIGTNYLADSTPSLFQHYWSLGVEEQFYLLWPLILLIGYLLGRKSKRKLFWMAVVLVVLSFAACVVLTAKSQPWAFFSPPTRAWEFGVGGIAAFMVSTNVVQKIRRFAAFGGWLGLAGIVSAGVLFSASTPFPGYMAGIPVLATVVVILCGSVASKYGPSALLGMRPMVFIGTISYSLYLVHWPILIIPDQIAGRSVTLPVWLTLLLALLAVPIAYGVYRWVELPGMHLSVLSRRKPRVTLISIAVVSLAITAVSGIGLVTLAKAPIDSGRIAEASAPSRSPRFTPYVPSNLVPSLLNAKNDNPTIYADGCHADFDVTRPIACVFGDANAPHSVELFGDSHAAEWFPAFKRMADEGLIRLRVDTKSSCPSVTVPKMNLGNPYRACDSWRAAVIDQVNHDRPDLVVMSNFERSDGLAAVDPARWSAGLKQTIKALTGAGRIAVIEDTPMFGSAPALCLSAHINAASECSRMRSVAVNASLVEDERDAAIRAGAIYVDLTDYICSKSECGPIIGDTLVYRDNSHLTKTFVKTLTAPIERALFKTAQ